MNKDKKKGLSPDKEPIPVSPARAGEVRQQHPRANMRPVASAGSTERGGYGYPDLLSWSPVALPSLPSGRERQRHRDRISACALQAREHTAEGQGRTALPLQPAFAKIFQCPQDPCSHPRRLYGIGLWSRRSRVRAPSVTPFRARLGVLAGTFLLQSHCNPAVWR